jgi:N-acetylglucosaminyldiphosphoundecaprenol N-acetyl-beta-D-mannosaminyltransferase
LKLLRPAQVIAEAEALLQRKQPQIEVTLSAKTTPSAKLSETARLVAPFPTARILGVRVHGPRFAETLVLLEAFIASGQPHQVATVNPEFLVAAYHDPVFRRVLNRAALAVPDGVGVLKAAGWLKQARLPERVPGVELVEVLAEGSARRGYTLFFLGAMPGVADQAAAILRARYPGTQIVGTFSGSPRGEDEAEIVAHIQAVAPDVVLVAYGAPKQDKWIARNMARLPASVLMGVGGAFDFISGSVPRAPAIMRRLNLEWLYRLVTQPTRWRRIWNAVPRFTALVWRERFFGER